MSALLIDGVRFDIGNDVSDFVEAMNEFGK